tara:strand:+ start:748 stop:1191 length:444 start_codon:yes stop_codon:yes gene_type:complete
MIGQTEIDEHLKKALLLDDSIAWLDSHTNEVKKMILDYIRNDQLFDEGIDSNEQIIGTYSYWTEVLSNGKKRMGEPYTLKDTGQFYRSMYVKVLNDSILIDADYTKMEDKNWWSIDILGLTEENLEKYAEMVKKNFILYARRVLELD